MKRDPGLQGLSRDHHQALEVALRLRRADSETVADAVERFREFWGGHGRRHFELEEQVLLPAYAAHGDPRHPAVAEVLTDHVELRRRAGALLAEPSLEDARALGERLSEHVRLEERTLFPLIEAAMPADELAALGARLAEEEAR